MKNDRSEDSGRRTAPPSDCECTSHNGFLTRKGYELTGDRKVDSLTTMGSVSAFENGNGMPELASQVMRRIYPELLEVLNG